MARLARAASVVVFLALVGCAALPGGGLIPRDAVARLPDFPGCADAQNFLFAGETSLAAIGLADDFGGGADPMSQRVGTVVVTAEPVDLMGPGPGGPVPQEPLTRAVCIQFEDGSGMAGPLPDDWQPPGGIALPEGSGADGSSGPPLGLLALVAAGLAVAGVSWLAFRERPSD